MRLMASITESTQPAMTADTLKRPKFHETWTTRALGMPNAPNAAHVRAHHVHELACGGLINVPKALFLASVHRIAPKNDLATRNGQAALGVDPARKVGVAFGDESCLRIPPVQVLS